WTELLRLHCSIKPVVLANSSVLILVIIMVVWPVISVAIVWPVISIVAIVWPVISIVAIVWPVISVVAVIIARPPPASPSPVAPAADVIGRMGQAGVLGRLADRSRRTGDRCLGSVRR